MAADGLRNGGEYFVVVLDPSRISGDAWGRRLVCGALLGFLLMLQVTSGVAQESDRTRMHGSERRVEWPSRLDISGMRPDQTEEADSDERQRSAAGILVDASGALQQGDVMLARRRLEVLIETYPETPAADLARERLLAMFGAGGGSRGGRSLEAERWGVRRGGPPSHPTDTGERSRAGRDPAGPRSVPGQDEALSGQRRQLQDERRHQMLWLEFQRAAGDRVFFAETSSDLGSRARAVIAGQARWLGRHSDLPVVVEAHADDHRTNHERDTELSQKRAEAVASLLIEQGVIPDRIVIYAYGRDRPIATCQAPECAAQNRRVVVRIGGGGDGSEKRRRGLEEPALATVPRRSLRAPDN
jgi:peptidoglycan-associated lipoprotein